mgnify:CR=1 FL=1
MANKKQKLWQNAKKVLMSLEYKANSEYGFSIVDDIYKGNKKKAIRDTEKGHLSEITKKDMEDLKAWFRHNQQKQNHMNAHSSFYECSQLRLKSWEIDGIGHSNFNGPRYQNPRTTKELTKGLNIEYK